MYELQHIHLRSITYVLMISFWARAILLLLQLCRKSNRSRSPPISFHPRYLANSTVASDTPCLAHSECILPDNIIALWKRPSDMFDTQCKWVETPPAPGPNSAVGSKWISAVIWRYRQWNGQQTNIARVSTERFDVLLYPFQRKALIFEASVARYS